MRFQVGALPETCELEPNNPGIYTSQSPDPPLDMPVVLNGQIKPGDIDRFRLRAKRGQQLVIETRARQLVPYLADAVPGWFQPTLALYDDEGDEIVRVPVKEPVWVRAPMKGDVPRLNVT